MFNSEFHLNPHLMLTKSCFFFRRNLFFIFWSTNMKFLLMFVKKKLFRFVSVYCEEMKSFIK